MTVERARASDVDRVARAGVEGSGGVLPHRAQLEGAFHADLSRIRVHAGAPARAACETLGAAAYTLGRDIAIAVEPSPWVLAHEVAHTIQQGATPPRSPGGGASGGWEAQADRAASAAVAGRPAHATRGGAGPQFLRIDDKQSGKFPRSETYVREEMPRTVNDARLMKAVNEAGRNIGSAARDHRKDLSWGSGPTVRFEKRRPGKLGGFEPGTSVLKIMKKGVKAPLKWQLVVEHLPPGTSEWKASRTRRSLELDTEGFGDVTNQIVRSEDLTDRDFNDLEIRVRRTSAMVKKPSP